MPTTYKQLEPIGFGLSPFGEEADNKEEIEFGRGFGDQKTKYATNTTD